ncbi:hypothetical protein AGMMS50293_17080 [Spirochaetia bacterium]|nr:hypothetical protein AGMMS50293_17080 [Spirochaetia bacterium]
MRQFLPKKPLFFAVCLALCLAAAGFGPLFGLDLPARQIADDSLFRIRMKDTWLTESPSRVLTRRPVLQNLESGERVELRVEVSQDEFMIIFARELMGGRIAGGAGSASAAIPRTGSGNFPGWAQGSWVLTRHKDTGTPVRIRVFLRSDPYTYVQFRPLSADKCQMDVVLYNAYVVRSLPLPLPLERLFTMPVNDALNLAGDKFPGKYFDPDPANYRDQWQFITKVRERLSELHFDDDGAIDENGNYVFIASLERQTPASSANGEISANSAISANGGLNCSGFAKWLIDGILRPVTGERMAIPPLKAPYGNRGSSFTEPWEALRDPFFGLDWIRNLAAAAGSTLRSPAYGVLDEFEVHSEPFSQIIKRSGKSYAINSYPGFLEDAGYGAEGIQPLLYTLAIDEPGKFYLAAINTEMGPAATADNPRGRPRLRQYFHIAALVPYFNEYGVFQVAVFESAEETSFNAFNTRYPGHYINLVRIPLSTAFDP